VQLQSWHQVRLAIRTTRQSALIGDAFSFHDGLSFDPRVCPRGFSRRSSGELKQIQFTTWALLVRFAACVRLGPGAEADIPYLPKQAEDGGGIL
jgi:hypothetical protein